MYFKLLSIIVFLSIYFLVTCISSLGISVPQTGLWTTCIRLLGCALNRQIGELQPRLLTQSLEWGPEGGSGPVSTLLAVRMLLNVITTALLYPTLPVPHLETANAQPKLHSFASQISNHPHSKLLILDHFKCALRYTHSCRDLSRCDGSNLPCE